MPCDACNGMAPPRSWHSRHAARPATAPDPRVKPVYWDEATRTLAKRDRVLRKLIRAYPDIHLKRRSDPFTTLARAIVGQQISVKAADTRSGAGSSRRRP